MKVSEALDRRISVRAFLDRPVPRALVCRLLEGAARSPSGGNLQPWHVHVVDGPAMARLKALMPLRLAERPGGEGTEYPVYPARLEEPYRGRRFKCGEDLYATLAIGREDKAARRRHFARNFAFFGAPLALFLSIDRQMGVGQWADLGMFLQSILLLALELGLDGCAQEAWAMWPGTIGTFLDLPAGDMLFCGVALGYRDPAAPVNGLRTDRAALTEFVRFVT